MVIVWGADHEYMKLWTIKLSSTNKAYWTSRENSLELIKLSSTNKVSLVYVSSRGDTGSTRDDFYWTSSENSLKLILYRAIQHKFPPVEKLDQ
jgi:hypothetical protein